MKVSIPDRKSIKLVDFPRLDGGLNLWELDYRLDSNQSPEMKNMWWQDGILQCRDGQTEFWKNTGDRIRGVNCCSDPFWDHIFLHLGNGLFFIHPASGAEEPTDLGVYISHRRGTFFRYGDYLFYKTHDAFVKIAYNADENSFSATHVADEAYTPVIVINAHPSTGSGTLYQPENRLSAKKTVWYNAVDGVKEYKLPVTGVGSIVEVKVDGAVTTAYTADLAAGKVTFTTAPPVTEPATNNTVQITYSKENPEAMQSIMSCRYAAVYGGDQNVCIVLGGCTAQPNAFFWNSNDSVSMNYAYFPMSYYNFSNDTEDEVTGFGKQHGNLVVFKKRSIGRVSFGVEDVDGRDSISLTYTSLNERLGCDLPWSIQLVENNLVFCNTENGVHLICDASAAHENNIVCISKNVNGTDQRPGLLYDLRYTVSAENEERAPTDPYVQPTCSYDDNNRYWIVSNGHAYLWDYQLSSWNNPSWFYFTNISAAAFFHLPREDKTFYLNPECQITVFKRDFMDYGGAIEKVYQFPPQFFDTYDRLKDVMYCIFTVRSDTDSVTQILYQSDYETRADMTPIYALSYHLVPRNLAARCLSYARYAHVSRRKPGCRHVRHFAMRLSNDVAGQDLSIVSAQIYFRYSGRDR